MILSPASSKSSPILQQPINIQHNSKPVPLVMSFVAY